MKRESQVLDEVERSFNEWIHPLFASVDVIDVEDPQITLGTASHGDYTYCLVRVRGKFEKLSPRQKDVAILAARGLSNKKIAEKLGIHAHTVASHIASILRKVSASSRASLKSSIWVKPSGTSMARG